MVADPLQTVLDLLSTNWLIANTDNTKPTFVKVTDKKRIDFNTNKDFILAHRTRPRQDPAGVGVLAKNQFYPFDLDVRVFGSAKEDHFYKIIDEIDRIMDANIILLDGNYDILNPDGQRQDKSDGLRKNWRMIISIQLEKYAKSRS